MSPEVLALLAIACAEPPAEPVRLDPALTADLAALCPGPVASPPEHDHALQLARFVVGPDS